MYSLWVKLIEKVSYEIAHFKTDKNIEKLPKWFLKSEIKTLEKNETFWYLFHTL